MIFDIIDIQKITYSCRFIIMFLFVFKKCPNIPLIILSLIASFYLFSLKRFLTLLIMFSSDCLFPSHTQFWQVLVCYILGYPCLLHPSYILVYYMLVYYTRFGLLYILNDCIRGFKKTHYLGFNPTHGFYIGSRI